MSLSPWKPGTLYLPGSLVVPTIVGPTVSTGIANSGFESGDVSWTKGTGWEINTVKPFQGTWSARYSGAGPSKLTNTPKVAVLPGKKITAKCMVQSGAGLGNAAVLLTWYTAADVLVSSSVGNQVSSGSATVWKQSTVTGIAPNTAAKVSIAVTANVADVFPVFVDNFQWDYVSGTVASSFAFKAIQVEAGLSGLIEPVWPTVVGNTVVDNVLTWQAVTAGSVTWEASSVLTSGTSEPTWPAEAGAFISDGNISWEAVPLRITDPNCPQTKVVAIAASKVFAGNQDIVNFCATLNARDWSSEDDAGFLPTGLQQKSQIGVTAMGVYRGNLAVWSPSTFQIWQVDPDPAAMALLDAMEGIGSVHQQAAQPVSDDLFFLPPLGVRTVSIAEGSNNLQSGDAGVPIDVLVQAEMTADVEPIATYYVSGGQYWLAFRTLTIPILAVGAFLLTSTIYPIEAIDGMQLATSFLEGSMQPINFDEADLDYTITSGDVHPILINAGPYEEAVDLEYVIQTSDIHKVKISTGPGAGEAVDLEYIITSGNIDAILVRAEMPDEGLDMGISLRNTLCSMTHI